MGSGSDWQDDGLGHTALFHVEQERELSFAFTATISHPSKRSLAWGTLTMVARATRPVLALAKKFLDHREQSLTAVALVWSLQPVGPRDIELAHLVLQGSALQTEAFCRAARAGNPA